MQIKPNNKINILFLGTCTDSINFKCLLSVLLDNNSY